MNQQRYQVINQDGVWIEIEKSFPGEPGDLLWAYALPDKKDSKEEENKNEEEKNKQQEERKIAGVVVGNGDQALVPAAGKDLLVSVEKRILDIKPKALELLVGKEFFIDDQPSLLIVLAKRGNYKPGRLVWEFLHFTDTNAQITLIARGDDRNSPGKIEVIFPGGYRQGIYTLKASLYLDSGKAWLEDSRVWHVAGFCHYLSSGGSLDKQPPLFYNSI